MATSSEFALIVEVSRITPRLCTFARGHGLVPVVVSDGAAAETVLAERGVPRLLIIDPALAKVDGLAIVRSLRSRPGGAAAPVLVLSRSRALREAVERAADELGVSRALSQDAPLAELREAFRALLEGEVEALTTRRRFLTVEATAVTKPAVRRLGTERDPDEPIPAAKPVACMTVPAGTPPEAELAAELASIAHTFGVDTVLVTLVLGGNRTIRGHFGRAGLVIRARDVPEEQSFCHHVYAKSPPTPLVVGNAFEDPIFSKHPLVQAGLIGSYVGVPLVTYDGGVLGSLCLIDPGPWLGGAMLVDALTARAACVARIVIKLPETETWRQRAYDPLTDALFELPIA